MGPGGILDARATGPDERLAPAPAEGGGMTCPRPHCGGLLLEEDEHWFKCSACARPIRKTDALAQQPKEAPMAKDPDKCPAKYCRNDAATCDKHGGAHRNPPQRAA
jgi:hypothetical protein